MTLFKFPLVFFMLNFCCVFGQRLYPIHDSAFLNYLKDSIPNCIKNDSLIIDSAYQSKHDIIVNVNYSYLYDITNVDGIQFFKKIHTLDLFYTHIATLPNLSSDSLEQLSIVRALIQTVPSLDSLPNLQNLTLEFDSIRYMPKLSHLKELKLLAIVGSDLDSLPSLDSLKHLSVLAIRQTNGHFKMLPSLSNNKELMDINIQNTGLSSPPFLDSCPNLLSIYLSHNNLNQLPSLDRNILLQTFTCDHNQITNLPFLGHCTNIRFLMANNNLIDTIKDLSLNVRLNTIQLDSNKLEQLPDLNNLTSLQFLHASANRISSFSFLPNTSSIGSLDLSHNLLSEFPTMYRNTPYNWLLNDNLISTLPDYQFSDSFVVIDISANKLDFSDALNIKYIDDRVSYDASQNYPLCCGGYSNVGSFVYISQKPFGTADTTVTLTYSDTVLTISDQHYADSYQWYHNGLPVSGSTDTILHIYCATQADAGIYTCHSIGQYFNTHSFRFNYGITEFESEPKTLIVSPTIGRNDLAVLYPTVSSGLVTLKYALPEEQSLGLHIYDMKGSLVYQSDLSAQAHGEYKQALDLSFLSSGSYIARVQYSLGYNRIIRFVISPSK